MLGTLLNKRYVLTAMHCVKSGTVSAKSVTVSFELKNIEKERLLKRIHKIELLLTLI